MPSYVIDPFNLTSVSLQKILQLHARESLNTNTQCRQWHTFPYSHWDLGRFPEESAFVSYSHSFRRSMVCSVLSSQATGLLKVWIASCCPQDKRKTEITPSLSAIHSFLLCSVSGHWTHIKTHCLCINEELGYVLLCQSPSPAKNRITSLECLSHIPTMQFSSVHILCVQGPAYGLQLLQ